jgi:hypothetical protein
VRNDFGDTTWLLDKASAEATQRVVSECGAIQLRIRNPDAVAAAITAVSEVGNVHVPAEMRQLESAMFTTPGAHDISHSWHGFFSKLEGDNSPLGRFELFRRVPRILDDQARSAGLDLLSRAGSVRILLGPAAE